MSQPPHDAGRFLQRLSQSISCEPPCFPAIRVPRHENVYLVGGRAETVYFVESGQIKLLTLSREGKECLTDIRVKGDTFGESCLSGAKECQETATTMEVSTLRSIPGAKFFAHLEKHSLVEGYVQYLLSRIARQQQSITNLITVDSEHRLGETLLLLARRLGRQRPGGRRIEQKITHNELSQMVGTTRPRITEFMLNFRRLELITLSREHHLTVNENKLAEYLARPVR